MIEEDSREVVPVDQLALDAAEVVLGPLTWDGRDERARLLAAGHLPASANKHVIYMAMKKLREAAQGLALQHGYRQTLGLTTGFRMGPGDQFQMIGYIARPPVDQGGGGV